MMLPNIAPSVVASARQVWKQSIAQYGRHLVTIMAADDTAIAGPVRAFCKRPKILGLFDRTEQSYDQERYMVMLDADDMPTGLDPQKFMRVRWDDEDHVVLSSTVVELQGVAFGYRILVKG